MNRMNRKKPPHWWYVAQSENYQAQYAELCTAEDAAGAQESHRFQNLTELCTWLQRVTRSTWWEIGARTWFRTWPYNLWNPDDEGQLDLHVVGRARTKTGRSAEADLDWYSGHLTIWLPRWSWRKDNVIHEVAHFVTPHREDQHGPLYARNRLEAQQLFGARGSAERLRQSFREHGVKVARGESRGMREER